jgi:hypothetical protein
MPRPVVPPRLTRGELVAGCVSVGALWHASVWGCSPGRCSRWLPHGGGLELRTDRRSRQRVRGAPRPAFSARALSSPIPSRGVHRAFVPERPRQGSMALYGALAFLLARDLKSTRARRLLPCSRVAHWRDRLWPPVPGRALPLGCPGWIQRGPRVDHALRSLDRARPDPLRRRRPG